jgi:hypothetical protein
MPIRSTPGHGALRRGGRLQGRRGMLIPWSGSAVAFRSFRLHIWDRALDIEQPAWRAG